MTKISLSRRQTSNIMSEAAVAAGVIGYCSQSALKLRGSEDSVKGLTVTITTDKKDISIAVSEGRGKDPARIQMPRSHFPGTAREFLRDLTFDDPDAGPLPYRLIARGHCLCISAKDGGY